MKKRCLLCIGGLMVFIIGCRMASPTSLFNRATATPELQFELDGFSFGAQEWPEYLPEEIPPIPGTIGSIMADDTRVRIFFEEVSEKEMHTYLQEFEDRGFSLKYLLFYADSEQEPTQKDIDKGAYDAVDIIKGEIQIRIEYGDNEGTMDINAQPFAADISTGPHWPDALVGVLPEPDCALDVMMVQSDGAGNMFCNSENINLLAEYSETLMANGFELVHESRNQNSQVYAVQLTKDDIIVDLREYQPGEIGITVQLN
ncbi:MAG: hypothetical protein JEZ00_07850 [Anaerolineaceae bacterium]|nr:hypothetical protein [Anaerolineaceae bacterium]